MDCLFLFYIFIILFYLYVIVILDGGIYVKYSVCIGVIFINVYALYSAILHTKECHLAFFWNIIRLFATLFATQNEDF